MTPRRSVTIRGHTFRVRALTDEETVELRTMSNLQSQVVAAARMAIDPDPTNHAVPIAVIRQLLDVVASMSARPTHLFEQRRPC